MKLKRSRSLAQETSWAGGVALGGLEKYVVGEDFGGEFEEAAVVIDGHFDIDIVIPGDEAAVPDRAQEGAPVQPVAKAGLGTDGVEHFEKTQHDKLAVAQGGVAFGSSVGEDRIEIAGLVHRRRSIAPGTGFIPRVFSSWGCRRVFGPFEAVHSTGMRIQDSGTTSSKVYW
jgi:hypothetical protein